MAIAPLVAAYQQQLGNTPGPFLGGGEPLPVTFPTTPLTFRVYIALGADLTASWLTWSWTDITEFVRLANGIDIADGGADEALRVAPGRTILTLDNRDGRFSRRNPTGPYFGLLSRNTPLWIQVDAGSGFKTRAQHFVNEWPRRWDKSANDCVVTIVASGILRRLQQGTRARSALRMTLPASSPLVYLPLEDGTHATQFASGLVNGTPATLIGLPESGSGVGPVGSAAVANFAATANTSCAGFAAISLTGATAGFIGVSLSIKGTLTSDLNPVIMQAVRVLFDTGDIPYLYITAYARWTGTEFDTNATGLDVFVSGGPSVGSVIGGFNLNMYDGEAHDVHVRLAQNGSAVDAELWIDGVQVDANSSAAVTLGTPTFLLGPAALPGTLGGDTVDNTGTALALGHITVHDDATALDDTDYHTAATGHAGENAAVRIARVCAEVGIAFLAGGATQSITLGPQPVAPPLDVLRDAEKADMGVLYEAEFGLAYQGKVGRYNTPVAFAPDYDLRQIAEPPLPTDDDQRMVNRFTAERTDGSFVTVEDPVSIASDGEYDDGDVFNTATDRALVDVAGWRIHRGTVDEDRWPAIELNPTRAPELIDDWTALGFGPRMNASNIPGETGPVDAFIEGRREHLDPFSWRAGVTTTPASVYEVYQVEGSDNRGRVDSATATLAADVSDVATSLSVATSGVLWVTGAVDFDVAIGGERMTVTDISGGSSPQTFTVTRSVNGVVKAHTATAPDGNPTRVRLWRSPVTAL